MQKMMIWLAPITVVGFVILLALMYGWVGDMNLVGSGGELPEFEATLAAQRSAQAQQPPQPAAREAVQFPAGIGNQNIQLIDQAFSAGIGSGQIQLIKQDVYLGLNLSELTPDLAARANMAPGAGLFVSGVVPTSPADIAGIKTGDVVIQCDGTAVATLDAAARIIGQKRAGQSIALVVQRNGVTMSFRPKMSNVPMGVEVGGLQNSPWLGADVQSIDAVMKIRFNLPDRHGVIVTQIAPGGPAASAGLQVGDVIRRFGATSIRDVEQLELLIQKSQPGLQTSLAVLRNNQQQEMSLTLGQKSADPNVNVATLPPGDVTIEASWIGMDLAELTAADAADLGLPADTKGIRVSDVEGAPASVSGFQVGDVIIGINGTPTPEIKQFVAASEKQAGAVVDVIRGNRHIYISVAPPGFTAQGTRLSTPLNKNLKQVALQKPVPQLFAIATTGTDLNSPLANDVASSSAILLIDPGNNRFAVLGGVNMVQLPDALVQQGVAGLICGNIDPALAKALSCAGILVYSGVVGSAADAVSLYQANALAPMKGF